MLQREAAGRGLVPFHLTAIGRAERAGVDHRLHGLEPHRDAGGTQLECIVPVRNEWLLSQPKDAGQETGPDAGLGLIGSRSHFTPHDVNLIVERKANRIAGIGFASRRSVELLDAPNTRPLPRRVENDRIANAEAPAGNGPRDDSP
jgi:hypothetical protein